MNTETAAKALNITVEEVGLAQQFMWDMIKQEVPLSEVVETLITETQDNLSVLKAFFVSYYIFSDIILTMSPKALQTILEEKRIEELIKQKEREENENG